MNAGTLAIARGGTNAGNSNTWLNSRITTNANGTINYNTGEFSIRGVANAHFVVSANYGSATSGVSGDGVILSELKNGEAIVLPRPGIAGAYIFITGNGSNHVGVETLIVGT